MTTQTATPAPATAVKPPLRIFLTILHLAGVGALGGAIFGMLGGLLGTGLGLLFAAGIGLVLLVGLVYAPVRTRVVRGRPCRCPLPHPDHPVATAAA